MIWALAGLGDEPAPFSNYNSGYTPTSAPVTAPMTPIVGTVPPGVLRMDSPPATQPSSMAGVDSTMIIGVLAAAAVVGLMAYRGEMSPNAKSRKRARYRRGFSASSKVELHLHQSGNDKSGSSLRKAISDLKKAGLRPGKVRRSKTSRGKSTWFMTVSTTLGKATRFNKHGSFRGYESFID